MSTRVYAAETRTELLKLIRLPAYAVPTFFFPLALYAAFGIAIGGRFHQGIEASHYLLATYGTFGVVGASLFGFGVSVAVERGYGWLALKRTTPMPPLAYFVAKMVTASAFGATIVLALIAIGTAFGGVRLEPAEFAALFCVLVAGTIPFCALGLAIGAIVKPSSAAATVNLVYLPMSLFAGLWMPIDVLPPAMQHIAPFLPTYHLAQLALGAIGAGSGWPLMHVTVLAIWAAAGLSAAAVGFRLDEGREHE